MRNITMIVIVMVMVVFAVMVMVMASAGTDFICLRTAMGSFIFIFFRTAMGSWTMGNSSRCFCGSEKSNAGEKRSVDEKFEKTSVGEKTNGTDKSGFQTSTFG